jgi:hypothetical protein
MTVGKRKLLEPRRKVNILSYRQLAFASMTLEEGADKRYGAGGSKAWWRGYGAE